MAYGMYFGSYQFPKGFSIQQDEHNAAVPSAKAPRADGAIISVGYQDAKRIRIVGGLYKGPRSNLGGLTLRQASDALRGALATGPQKFRVESDRYWPNMQRVRAPHIYDPTGYGRFYRVEVDLIGPTPFAIEDAVQSATQVLTASGQTISTTPGGNAVSLGQISITAGSTGLLTAVLTNAANGDSCSITGTVTSGDVLVIDSYLEQVTRSGIDLTSYFDGMWIRLEPGVSNVITLTWSSGSLSNVALSYSNWWN